MCSTHVLAVSAHTCVRGGLCMGSSGLHHHIVGLGATLIWQCVYSLRSSVLGQFHVYWVARAALAVVSVTKQGCRKAWSSWTR
jgi:hypothetical protein